MTWGRAMDASRDRKTAGIGKGTPGPGRRHGAPNKATAEFREVVRQLLADNSENVGKWLADVANGTQRVVEGRVLGIPGDPGKALDLLARLAEFAAPKMGRIELTGADGAPLPAPGGTVICYLPTKDPHPHDLPAAVLPDHGEGSADRLLGGTTR